MGIDSRSPRTGSGDVAKTRQSAYSCNVDAYRSEAVAVLNSAARSRGTVHRHWWLDRRSPSPRYGHPLGQCKIKRFFT